MDNAIHAILDHYQPHDRGVLIPILQDVQGHFQFLSPEMIDEIGSFTGVSPGEIFGVASFYSQFRFERPGEHSVRVCLGTACHVRGSARILELMERQLKIKAGQTTPDGQFSLEEVACFGCCALAPVVMVDKDVHGRMTSVKGQKLVKKYGG